eukprot:359956-Chlamydomonas_euryale.AAC.1
MSISFHGSCSGSRLDTILIDLPLTEMVESSTTLTSALKVPRMESYLSRCDACLTPPESFTHTTSSIELERPSQQRRKLRPMRPKPLMATFSFFSARTSMRTAACRDEEGRGQRSATAASQRCLLHASQQHRVSLCAETVP